MSINENDTTAGQAFAGSPSAGIPQTAMRGSRPAGLPSLRLGIDSDHERTEDPAISSVMGSFFSTVFSTAVEDLAGPTAIKAALQSILLHHAEISTQ